jgi:hypothetical protein
MNPKDEHALTEDNHFIIKELPNGKVVAVVPMIASAALVLVTEDYLDKAVRRAWNGWQRRFCYAGFGAAVAAAAAWDGTGDPPGDWVKEKSPGVDRLNPGFATQADEEESRVGDQWVLRGDTAQAELVKQGYTEVRQLRRRDGSVWCQMHWKEPGESKE